MVDVSRCTVVELAEEVARIGDPERCLSAIAELHKRLADLEEFQVEEALRRGRSWKEIGDSLGKSRQAVHRRYARLRSQPPRARRVTITAAARQMVALARVEAEGLGSRAVAPEHLLVALVRSGAGPTGLSLNEARAAARSIPRRRPTRSGLTPKTRQVLEQSLRECVQRGDRELRPEHMLHALAHVRSIFPNGASEPVLCQP
jgi:ATP-dependent Clp protease ATP-binding subunit ClpA